MRVSGAVGKATDFTLQGLRFEPEHSGHKILMWWRLCFRPRNALADPKVVNMSRLCCMHVTAATSNANKSDTALNSCVSTHQPKLRKMMADFPDSEKRIFPRMKLNCSASEKNLLFFSRFSMMAQRDH